jgi:hypothetical protein
MRFTGNMELCRITFTVAMDLEKAVISKERKLAFYNH